LDKKEVTYLVTKTFSLRSLLLLILTAISSLILHWKVFSYDLAGNHAIRQAQTQQNIQNFYRHDSNILNPTTDLLSNQNVREIRRFEFPVMQWSVAMVYHITGEYILVTRICMFLLGLGTLAGVYYWFQQFFKGITTAWAGTWAFSFSPVFYYYTMNPMPDNLALFGAIWSLAFFYKFLKSDKLLFVSLSAFFLSLSALAKLPYIIFLAVPGSWFIWNVLRKKFKNIRIELKFFLVYFFFLLPALLWYVWVIPTWNNGVVTGILENPITLAKVQDYLSFHFKEMFPKILLGYNSMPFLLLGLYFLVKKKVWKEVNFKWPAAMGLVVMVYWIYEFSLIEKVHDYYMMPFLPLLYLMVTYGIYQALRISKWTKLLTVALLVSMPLVTNLITKDYWSVENSYYLQDVFRYKNDLRAAAPSNSLCIIVNDPTQYLFSYLIDKPAFVFRDDHLPSLWVEDMVLNRGVTYMYSDSRKVDTNPEVSQYFEKLVMERGTVKVFKLKGNLSIH